MVFAGHIRGEGRDERYLPRPPEHLHNAKLSGVVRHDQGVVIGDSVPDRLSSISPATTEFLTLKATLNTGMCTTLTTTTLILVRCTATAPLTGNVSPSGTASITVLPPALIASQTSDFATRPASSPSGARSTSGSSRVLVRRRRARGLPIPTGTVNYKIDGVTVATEVFQYPATGVNRTGRNPYSTTGLALGGTPSSPPIPGDASTRPAR